MNSEKRRQAALSPPVLSLPDGSQPLGYGETYETHAFTGALSVTVPVPVLHARGAPSLSLVYTQGTANGAFGLGMSLSLPSITRRADKSIPRYDDRDVFLAPDSQELTPCCDGDSKGGWTPEERVAVEDGVSYKVRVYRRRVNPRLERIERWTAPDGSSFWKVHDAANGVQIFGRSANARVADPAAPLRVYEWLIEEQWDAHGNRISYAYKAEDGAGWTGWKGTGGFANKYIESIFYGNYRSGDDTDESFAFEVRFDYGEYDVDAPQSVTPARPWPVRSDPLLSCRAGFPLQTLRLCRRILILNHLPEASASSPCTARAMRLTYDENPVHSKLLSITLTGFRHDDGDVAQSSLPPLAFDYADYEPSGWAWRPLSMGNDTPLPGMVERGHFQMADLYGEGLPGIVLTMPETLMYFPPLGSGVYGQARHLPRIPNTSGLTQPRFILRDFDGSGRLSLVMLSREAGGFFYNEPGGEWSAFRAFSNYPPEIASAETAWSDLSGDGLADLIVQLPGQLRFYLSEGLAGFSTASTTSTLKNLPTLFTDDERSLVTFADMLGDGLSHCVKVASGRVEVWPNLGYGSFAQPFVMTGAPHFKGDLKADRILLGNFSGGRCADLLLVYSDHLELYLNQSGHGFAAAIRLPVPGGINALDQVSVADVDGRGRACLVVAKAGTKARHLYMDFCGDSIPYLLTTLNNGTGAVTSYQYRSSTDFSLQDRERGRPWAMNLAAPVMVVERVEHRDLFTGLINTESFEYRDGYFDPVERVFRGFGFSQVLEAQSYETAADSLTAKDVGAVSTSESRLTRLWFHAGALSVDEELLPLYRKQFYSGDTKAAIVGANKVAQEVNEQGGATEREAAAALAGSEIHREVYAVNQDGSPAAVPLSVIEQSHFVELLQPALSSSYASFNVSPREMITGEYEGIAEDPRIRHEAALSYNAAGAATQSVTVFYPRRQPELPEQAAMQAILREDDYLFLDNADVFLANLAWQHRESEVAGIHPSQGAYFTYDELAAQVSIACADANRLPYGADFTTGQQARLYHWAQTLFWDDGLTGPLAPGQSGAQSLVYRQQEAVFPESFFATVFGDRIQQSALTEEAALYQQSGYWWRASFTIAYFGAEGYYQPKAYQSPFQSATACTTVDYDRPYWLLAVKVTDAMSSAVTVQLDYQSLEPASLTDESGMMTDGLYDPLGRLCVFSQHAQVKGQHSGGMMLANYRRQPAPSVQEVLSSPETYLQGALIYFLHDDKGWTEDGSQPASIVAVAARLYPNNPAAASPAATPNLTVVHLDGFGHHAELLERVERTAAAESTAGGEWVWQRAHRVDYDQRNRLRRLFLPVFKDSPQAEADANSQYHLYTYDALDRQVRELLPKGFLKRVEYENGWTESHSDANDTIKDSPYYQQHLDDPKLSPAEKRALAQAVSFYNTPLRLRKNPQGFVIEEQRLNSSVTPGGSPVAYSTRHTVDVRGLSLAIADPRLSAGDTPNFRAVYDMLGRPVHVRRADEGDLYLLHDAVDKLIHKWTARGIHIQRLYDRPLRRLSREQVDTGDGTMRCVLAFEYGTDASTLSVNRIVSVKEQAGARSVVSYNLLGRPAQTTYRFAQQAEGIIDWEQAGEAQLFADQWQQAWEYDPAGRLLAEHCADGSVIRQELYNNGWVSAIRVELPGGGSPLQAIVGLSYLPSGQPSSAVYGNGVALGWSYDPLTLEPTRNTARLSTGERLFQDLIYTPDPVGNICSVVDNAAAAILGHGSIEPLEKQYEYDAFYRLLSGTGWEQTSSAAPQVNYKQSFTYDSSDNLIQVERATDKETASRSFSVAPDSNRAVPSTMLLSGKKVNDFFDASGNLLVLENGSALAYDFMSRAASVTQASASSPVAYYRYNAQGQRMRRRSVNGQGTFGELFHLGSAYIEEAVADGQTGQRSFTLHVTAPGDSLVLVSHAAGNAVPEARYLLSNHVGSVTMELDEQARVLRYSDYYPYGEQSVSITTETEPRMLQLGFSGKEHDAETGFNYFGGRYYQASWARWLTPDPIGEAGGINLYLYVKDNPATLVDPDGFMPTLRSTKKRKAALKANLNMGLNPRGTGRVRKKRRVQTFVIDHGKAKLVNFKFMGMTRRGLHPGSDYVDRAVIIYTGSRAGDFAAANLAVGRGATPGGYVWHHYHNYKPATNTGTLYLMTTAKHAPAHSGGVWQYEQHHGVAYT
ncbi:MAG TPA: SpvB/TcaC N-terminal domain-containing protein [Pyrinomonadaceae bacterium]|nr:SpvB/TcaC N-terminal domain-containing protein [Pyrinomonadaceae bacterium]